MNAAAVAKWVNALLAMVYPEVCQLCRQQPATPAEGFVCSGCRARARFIEPPFCERCGLPFAGSISQAFTCANCREEDWSFSCARSAVIAKNEVLEIVHRYKYNRALWFEVLLADWLVAKAQPALAAQPWDCVIPVPLHPSKEREREFNQAARLGRRLAAACGLPIHEHALLRMKPTATQTRLTREERRDNVRRAFAMQKGADVTGYRIVLVDDVFTTGATTNACAAVLCQAGAAEVCVWTVARGI